MNKIELQNIVLPNNERCKQNIKLFCRTESMIYDPIEGALTMGRCQKYDFATYLNVFSLRKWKGYSEIKNVVLHIEIEGMLRINYVAYHLDVYNPVRELLRAEVITCAKKTVVEWMYPDIDADMIAFEIETLSDGKFYCGYFWGEFDEADVHEVNLSLATTTFRKEEFIKRNIALLREEVLEQDDEMKNHFQIHVIDNGRTLDSKEFNCDGITVHPNKNVGGSGGFSRGMIETMHQEQKATHVLLMDDDVLMLPESIKRTYRLLTVLRPEYQDYFISGAMLRYEQMNQQHEDIGFVHGDGSYGPVKDQFDLYQLSEILRCNDDYLEQKNTYAGWWYCCIPMTAIEKNGLPLPLFIRGDDVEFSLRNNARFITMNGICVWHMGFTYKFSASMELYQVHRNSLILQAASGVCQEIDFMTRMKKLFRARLLSLDYNGAELILDALDDFLKGPSFIETDCGEKIMKEKGQKNEKLVPLSEFSDVSFELKDVYADVPRSTLHTWLYRITYNGHRFCSKRVLKNGPAVVAYDWFYSPERNFWNKRLLAVNPHLRLGAMRVLDRGRYHSLQKRYKGLLKYYDQNHIKIEQEYRSRFAEFVSENFWRKYLELDKMEG